MAAYFIISPGFGGDKRLPPPMVSCELGEGRCCILYRSYCNAGNLQPGDD